MIHVNIKLLSGDLISLEIDPKITCSAFFNMVYLTLNLRSISPQLYLSRNDFILIDSSEEPLCPQSEEIFNAFIDPFTYSVQVRLTSTEVFDVSGTNRHELYEFSIKEYDGSPSGDNLIKIKTQAIYISTEMKELSFLLQEDIPSEVFGRYKDEWSVDIPEDIEYFHTLQELLEHSDLGEGLSDRAKQYIITLFSFELSYYKE
jgi:hypothetical protein